MGCIRRRKQEQAGGGRVATCVAVVSCWVVTAQHQAGQGGSSYTYNVKVAYPPLTSTFHMLLAGAWRQLAVPRPASTCSSWTKPLGQRLQCKSSVQRRQHLAAAKTIAMSKESTPERDRDVARVTEVVGAFLRTADLEVCTEKQVIAHVQKSIGDQLSQPVSAYKKTITGVIEAYLEEMDEAEAQPEEEEQAPKGKKRAGGPAAGAGTSKRARVPGVDDSDTQFSADLGHKRFARVRTYQGRLHVDIREFYEVRSRCIHEYHTRRTSRT